MEHGLFGLEKVIREHDQFFSHFWSIVVFVMAVCVVGVDVGFNRNVRGNLVQFGGDHFGLRGGHPRIEGKCLIADGNQGR